jgi:hypothetical protein
MAMLVLLDVAAIAVAAILSWLSDATIWPVALLAASLMAGGFALSVVWTLGGRRFVTIGALVRIPAYILWKLPLYLGFVRRGTPEDWIRTRAG